MPLSHDIRQQLLQIDEQLIDILTERMNVSQKALEEDEHAFDAASQAEMISDWENAAEERGLNLTTMNHLCKLVLKLCQTPQE